MAEIREERCIHFVHSFDIRKVFEEDIDFNDIVKRNIDAFQNGFPRYFQTLCSLRFTPPSTKRPDLGSMGSCAERLL